MTDAVFRVEPASGLLDSGGWAQPWLCLRSPDGNFTYRVSYTFDPDDYTIGISGSMDGVTRALLVGPGELVCEADSALEQR